MSPRPEFIRHVSELPDNGGSVWPWTGSDEVLGVRTSLSRPLGLVRVGVHHDRLRPGERSSHPHAERWEEECVYILEGRPDACIDGAWHPLAPGDIAVFAPGTGIEHTIVNRTDSDVCMLVVGERIDTAHRAAEQWLATWNEPEPPDLAEVFTADAEWIELASGETRRGRTAIAAGLAEGRERLGGGQLEALSIVPSARAVALEWRWNSQPATGALAAGPGTHVHRQGLSMATLEGIRIARLVESG